MAVWASIMWTRKPLDRGAAIIRPALMALDFSAILAAISQVLLPDRFLLPSTFGTNRPILGQTRGPGAIRMMKHYWQRLSCGGEIGLTICRSRATHLTLTRILW